MKDRKLVTNFIKKTVNEEMSDQTFYLIGGYTWLEAAIKHSIDFNLTKREIRALIRDECGK